MSNIVLEQIASLQTPRTTVKRLAKRGWKQACRDDAGLFLGLNVVEGKVVYPAVAEAFGLPLADAKTLL